MKQRWVLITLFIATIIALAYSQHTPALAATQSSATTLYLPLALSTGNSNNTGEPPWLVEVNRYRTQANLPPVVESTYWSTGAWLHSRYMVKMDEISHYENPSSPWYTLEGAVTAQSSELLVSHDLETSDIAAIGAWMQAPFHGIGILDPQLQSAGFGSYHEADGGFQSAATLDILHGLGPLPYTVKFPIKWPADGSTVFQTIHWGEQPSPLTACSGYSAPAGLPVTLQIGDGSTTPVVSGHSFKQGDTELEYCIIDETSYTNPDAALQAMGRGILDTRDAIILVPRDPLTPGASYTVSITANGQTHTWSFTVSVTAQTMDTFQDATSGNNGRPELAAPMAIN